MAWDVAVIGGGVSGLATAVELRRRGRSVVVLERQTRAGGNAQSERIGGFLMEHGPSTVASTAEAALAHSRALGLESDRCELGEGVRRRYLVRDGGLNGIATGPFGFLAADYLSLLGRLRMMAEIVVPRGRVAHEETVAEFCARRFGREFGEQVMDPLVAGIYAGRADAVSVDAIFPKLPQLEARYGSVARGMLARVRAGARMPASRFCSWRDGVGSLPRALAAHLGEAVRTGVAVTRIQRRSSRGFRIETAGAGMLETRAVVMATQPHVVAPLLADLALEAAAAAAEIAAPPLAVVFLGYRRADVAHPLDGLGFLCAESEGRQINGAQFTSTMFPGRAPDGAVAIAGFFGGARRPEVATLPAEELIDLARQEFADLIGAHGEPLLARVRHWPRGLPQYTVGHAARAAALRTLDRSCPGGFATGNYFEGPSVGVCVDLASDTAHRVDQHLDVPVAETAPMRASG